MCFGHWGPPQCLKNKIPQYQECDYDKIPTGSIWFGFDLTPYGAVRSLASGECFNRTGIIVQIKQKVEYKVTTSDGCGCQQKKCKKCYKKVPYVFTTAYNGKAGLIPLRKLAQRKTLRQQAVRPRKPAINKCIDAKIIKSLSCNLKEMLKSPYDTGACAMRQLFNLDVSNPTFESYSDTKLVFTILARAGLLTDNGCCESSSSSCSCEVSAGGSTRLTCESSPVSEKCCKSSSSSDKCEVSCYQASLATITDLLYDNACGPCGCLDLRWFSKKVEIDTCCGARGVEEAIDAVFKCEAAPFMADLRDLLGCWTVGKDLPCAKRCAGNCRGQEDHDQQRCRCTPEEVAAAFTALETLYSWLSGVNYAGLPTPLPTALNGNTIAALANQIANVLNGNCKPATETFTVSSTYTYPSSGGLTVAFTTPVVVTTVNTAHTDVLSRKLAEELEHAYGGL